MNRRVFVAGIAALLAAPLAAEAQPASVASQEGSRTFRVGFVGLYSSGLAAPSLQGYQQRLRELGWVEGQNIQTTYRWADGHVSRILGLVRGIVATSPDLLILPCGDPMNAARDLRPDIPIVARCMDPAGFGREIVTAARPAGFTTGVTDFSPGATPRRLELLKELVPNLWRVGVLYHPQSSWVAHWSEVEAAARAMGVSLERIEWNASSNPGDAFHIADKRGVRVLMTLGGVNAYLNRELVFELAAQYRMPVLYDFPMFPTGDEVGLIAYYADATAMYITVAEQVDQILRGRKPGDIPLALPQTFRLVINAKAARALGLSISPSLRRQANEVIE